jgi:hypothetical protein
MNNTVHKLIVVLGLFAALGIAVSVIADDSVTKFSCGRSSITLYNSNIEESPFFVITVWNGRSQNSYSLPATQEFLNVRCEKDNKGNDYLLVSHLCGGSACSESNYALIALDNNKQVLNASERYKGNGDKAASILGKTIRPFSCKKRSKGAVEPNESGEYCLVSRIILG